MICYFVDRKKKTRSVCFNTKEIFPIGTEINFYKGKFTDNVIVSEGYYKPITNKPETDSQDFYVIKKMSVYFHDDSAEMVVQYECKTVNHRGFIYNLKNWVKNKLA